MASLDGLVLLSRGFNFPRPDRLTFGGNIIETDTDSYRLASTENRNRY